MLEIKDLHATVDGKEILKGLTLNVGAGEVRLANAGHPTPLHLERGAGRVTSCTLPFGPGPALGLMPEFVYDTVRCPLASGDTVLLFTDEGNLILARLSGEGYEEISRFHLLDPTYSFGTRKVAWTPPSYANGHVFARNDKELVCFSLESKSAK